MATPDVQASLGLYNTAQSLMAKGHYARAAEKLGAAAAAAARELAADEDCLVVAFLRTSQADSLYCHSLAPTLTDVESIEACEIIKFELLPHFVSTVTRRKAAGTLLPGSCRATELAWWQAAIERRLLQEGKPVDFARAFGVASAPTMGLDVYFHAARIVLEVLNLVTTPFTMSREMQLSHAAFLASALDLLAQPRELPYVFVDGVCKGVLTSVMEIMLAAKMPQMLQDACTAPYFTRRLGGEVLSILADGWRRVERSGVVATRLMDKTLDPATRCAACFDAAATEAAVRGLRECALAGCGAKEVHVSQFKRCSACRQAFYCCREHQVADWPAHKAACKAARKASSK